MTPSAPSQASRIAAASSNPGPSSMMAETETGGFATGSSKDASVCGRATCDDRSIARHNARHALVTIAACRCHHPSFFAHPPTRAPHASLKSATPVPCSPERHIPTRCFFGVFANTHQCSQLDGVAVSGSSNQRRRHCGDEGLNRAVMRCAAGHEDGQCDIQHTCGKELRKHDVG